MTGTSKLSSVGSHQEKVSVCIFFIFKIYLFFILYACFACICACVQSACMVPMEVREDIRVPGTGVESQVVVRRDVGAGN